MQQTATCSKEESRSWVPDKWDRTFDVVIIGSGAAGFAAAIEASDHKASVVILEKMPTIGGNSILSGGNYGVPCTDIQKKQGEKDSAFRDDSVELYYQEKRKLGGYRSNPVLTHIFVERALDGYQWIKNMGVSWRKVGMYEKPVLMPENPKGMHFGNLYNPDFVDGQWIGNMTKGRHHIDCKYKDFKNGKAFIMAMSEASKKRTNIKIVTKAKVFGIIREEILKGDVLGVWVKDLKDNKEVTYRAKKAVVLAAGGFSANGKMCAKYDPRLNPKYKSSGSSGATGEALIEAVDIGADTVGMDFIQIRMARSAISYGGMLIFNKTGTYIDIDSKGERFWKEMDDVTAFRYARLTELNERGFDKWWSISDSGAVEANEVKPEELQASLRYNYTAKADTIEELARIVNVPSDALQATINRYNLMVAKGEDEDFGQEKANLKYKIENAPFFAVPRTYYRHHTCGGVCINEKAQVLDRRGQIIPRLYAAGEIVGGVHGLERNGGCGLTECIVFGRIAGTEAAVLVNKA